MGKKTTRKSAAKASASSKFRKAKNPRKVRVCMIGCGGMANAVHYPSLNSFKDVEFAGVCDLLEDRLQSTCDKYDIPADRRFLARNYDDYRKMIEKVDPDAVYVIGQPHIMYDIWTWCLSQGLNLYIEKPLGLSVHQARSLAHLAEEHNCITQVSFQRRIAPIVTKCRDLCLEKGPVVHAVCRFYKCAISPMLGARDHMMDDTVHSIDTVRWMCGGEVVEVESHCKRIGVPDINFISATLQFDNGSTGFLINSWCSGRRVFEVEIHSPGIYAHVEHEGKGIVYADGDYQGQVFDTREVSGSDENYVFGGFQAKNRDFIDAVKKGTLPQSNFGDAVHTMEVADVILSNALLMGE